MRYTPPLLRLSKAKVNGNFNFVYHYQGTDGLEHIRNLGKSHQERIVSSFCYPSPVSVEGTIADYWEEHYKVKLKAPLITQKHIIVPAADIIFHAHCHQVTSHQNSVV